MANWATNRLISVNPVRRLGIPSVQKLLSILVAIGIITLSNVANATNITITHLLKSNSWKVDYELPAPVEHMIFVRRQTLFRAASWKLVTDGMEIVLEGNHEVVRRVDGRKFQQFSIVAPSLTDQMVKDYSQNFRFTDGSELLYTGHFTIARNVTDAVDYVLRLVPAAGEFVVVRGQKYEGVVELPDPGDDGVFAYFGTLEPQQDQNYIAIVDPGLPDWLKSELASYLPNLFDFYAKRLGDDLPRRPTIYFSFEAGDSDSTHFDGGALLDGTYQLRASGKAWKNPDSELRVIVPASIAHESVHLWNGHVTPSDGDEGTAWMHEGGAEILAWRAMQDLHFLSAQEFDAKVCSAYRQCGHELGGRALNTVTESGDYQLLYSCGAMIGRLSDLALQQEGSDIFDFWRRLIGVAKQDAAFSELAYFELLTAISGNERLIEGLKVLVNQSHDDTGTLLKQNFGNVDATTPCDSLAE